MTIVTWIWFLFALGVCGFISLISWIAFLTTWIVRKVKEKRGKKNDNVRT